MSKASSVIPVVLVALVLSALGTFLLTNYIEGVRREAKASLKNQERVTVIVAARDIPANTQLRADMITTRSFAKDSVPSDSVTTIEELRQLYTRVPVFKEDVLRRSKLVTKDQAGSLAFRIPEGKRAITIGITEVKAVGYSINPGDRVDVIGIFDIRDERTEERVQVAQTILQDVQVLEISTAEPEDEVRSRRAARAPVATLSVSPEEAEVIALVENEMNLVLTLRPQGETQRVSTDGVRVASILGLKIPEPTPPPPAPEPQKTVEIFAGGNRQNAPVSR